MTDLSFKLNTGAVIPALGLGTWKSESGEVRAAVSHAIKSGYRHIDCAYVYGNEQEVGQGIKDGLQATGLKRSDIFITTKLWSTYHSREEEGLDKSLRLLGLEYVDLYLMHWPTGMNPRGNDEKFPTLPDGSRDLLRSRSHIETYKAMEDLLKTGKTKAIGVSNYSLRFLQELLPHVSVVPAMNQIENHPLLPQHDVVEYCKTKGILVTAYSPLGSTGSPLMRDERVVKIAQKAGVTPGTVLLSYHVARGSCVLAKSVTPSRIEENKHIIELDEASLATLSGLSKAGVKRYVYPAWGVDFGFPDKVHELAQAA